MSAIDTVFKASMPAFYDRYLGPVAFAPYARDMAGRLRDLRSGPVLEMACGTGIVTQELDRALAGGVDLVATDLSAPMLEVAAAKGMSPRVRFQLADAHELPFETASFQAVACQFGAMFFADKRRAFAEVARVLAPGGRFVFSVWDDLAHNDLQRTCVEALEALYPHAPPVFVRRVPYGYHDGAAIGATLREAGFAEIAEESVAKELQGRSPRESAIGACQGGPARSEIEAQGPGAIEAATEAVAAALERRFGPGPFVANSRAKVFTARR